MVITPPRGRIYDSITQTIGSTPLVRVRRLCEHYNAPIDLLLKLEFFNPIASVKDRIAVSMVDDMEQQGVIGRGTTLIEPTSGNTGIGLAFVCAARGYSLILCMPETMSVERRKMLRLLGARLELTPAALGMKGAIARAEELAAQIPGAIIPQQFANPANPAIHQSTTAREILADTENTLDAFIAGVGTGGTITGVGRVLKAEQPAVRVIAVEPTESPVLSGGVAGPHRIQGIGAGFVPQIVDRAVIDDIVTVSSDQALTTARDLARLEGIPAGISSGAAVAAALQLGQQPQWHKKRLVVLIPSFAERYLSTALFEGLEDA
jgi:cysteine synthase